MVFTNDIRQAILKVARERGAHSFSTFDVARELDATNWKYLEDQVRFVVDVMVQEGELTIILPEKQVGETMTNALFRKK